MNKIATVKLIARVVVGAGTTTVTKSIIDNNVAPGNMFHRISVAAASVVIGSMASEATKSHTDARIDQVVEAFTAKTESTETTTA
jgi:hypothetical protein